MTNLPERNRLISEALRQRPRMIVGHDLNEKISLREARKRYHKHVEAEYVDRAFLIRSKTFTASKLNEYEKTGALVRKPNIRGVKYLRSAIIKIIEFESLSRKMRGK